MASVEEPPALNVDLKVQSPVDRVLKGVRDPETTLNAWTECGKKCGSGPATWFWPPLIRASRDDG